MRMFPILGSKKMLCDGLTRRDLLHIGGLGAFGLTAGDWLGLKEAEAASVGESAHFGKAKSCILLFPYGSPAQHETFDPKPDAPVEIQGETRPIATAVPGLDVCEYLPQIAKIADRTTVVRSMVHPFPVHAMAYTITGMRTYTPAIEGNPRDPQHWPYIGSVVDYVESRRKGSKPLQVPRNIALPWVAGSKSDFMPLAGPYAAFLGNAYDPVWTDFEGKGTRTVPRLNDDQQEDVYDPFAGVRPTGRFRIASTERRRDIFPRRFDVRRSLLQQFDQTRSWLETHKVIDTYSKNQQAAYTLLSGNRIREALDVHRESEKVRQRYGMTLFGQSVLAARRLVEAGSKFVSVFWDAFGPFGGCCWDTHSNHFPRMKEYLLPVFDQTYSALILDLEQRGLLDETLVLCFSEHGRTPKIDSKPKGAGRHHWSRAYSAIYAGAGIARGKVVGRSDSLGGDVVATPVSPKDILATTFHQLGINPETTLPDRNGQPLPIAGDGIVRHELF